MAKMPDADRETVKRIAADKTENPLPATGTNSIGGLLDRLVQAVAGRTTEGAQRGAVLLRIANELQFDAAAEFDKTLIPDAGERPEDIPRRQPRR